MDNVTDGARDEAGLEMATQTQLDIYWTGIVLAARAGLHVTLDLMATPLVRIGSCVLNTIAFFAMVLVIREYFINKSLRAHAVVPYFGQVMADVLWCIAYVPYHYHNAIMHHLTSRSWCLFVCYAACTSITLSMMSGALIMVSTWDTIVSALHRRPPRLTMNIIVACWVIAIAGGIGWTAGMDSQGHAGDYRGMYCFLSNQGYWDTGGVNFTLIIVSSVVIQTFGYLTYKIVRANSVAPSSSIAGDGIHHHVSGGSVDPWNIIFRRTLLLLAIYFGSFIGNLILAPLNAARVDAPIEFEMIAGWLTKVKPTLDALAIYYTPSVRRAREARLATIAARRLGPHIGEMTSPNAGGAGAAYGGGHATPPAASRGSMTHAPPAPAVGIATTAFVPLSTSPPHSARQHHEKDGGWTGRSHHQPGDDVNKQSSSPPLPVPSRVPTSVDPSATGATGAPVPVPVVAADLP